MNHAYISIQYQSYLWLSKLDWLKSNQPVNNPVKIQVKSSFLKARYRIKNRQRFHLFFLMMLMTDRKLVYFTLLTKKINLYARKKEERVYRRQSQIKGQNYFLFNKLELNYFNGQIINSWLIY